MTADATDESGFNHAYPARECPEFPTPVDWSLGHGQAVLDATEPVPTTRNPFPIGSDKWRGYEFGVYAADRDGPGDEMRLTPGAT